MIAALPMYDRPELAAAHDAFWAGTRDALRARGVAAPERLSRDGAIWTAWRDACLLLGQTCGLPFRSELHGSLQLIATADYGLRNTPPGHYRSHLVVRAGDSGTLADYAARTLAINGPDSHSGWAAAWIAARAAGFAFRHAIATGAHRLSAAAVADGRADIAAIDAITWRGIAAFEPDLAARLAIIGQTPASPGQAFVAAPGMDAAALRASLDAGFAALAEGHRRALGMVGIVDVPRAAYLAEPVPPEPPLHEAFAEA